MRVLIDAQLPPALATWLGALGLDAVHVFDLQFTRATDPIIWQHARETAAVVVTKDEDFALLRRFATMWPQVVEALSRGETLIELV